LHQKATSSKSERKDLSVSQGGTSGLLYFSVLLYFRSKNSACSPWVTIKKNFDSNGSGSIFV